MILRGEPHEREIAFDNGKYYVSNVSFNELIESVKSGKGGVIEVNEITKEEAERIIELDLY